MRLELSRGAQADLDDIRNHGVTEFGAPRRSPISMPWRALSGGCSSSLISARRTRR
jgi:plasmid stabilization system protein ParE